MLLRICLIVAIVGGLAAAALNFVMVQKEITTIITDRDDQKTQKETAQKDLAKTKKDLASTKTKLDSTTKELNQTKNDLESAKSQVADLDKQKQDLDAKLTSTQQQRDQAQSELAKWAQLNTTPQQVLDTVAQLKKTITERDAFIAENKVLNKNLISVKAELATIIGTNTVPPEPAGLRGKIIDFDPKYGFVILDIGDNKGVVPKGLMMIARDGKLIGKVRINRVDKDKSVADVLPDWQQGQVMEGDEVLD